MTSIYFPILMVRTDITFSQSNDQTNYQYKGHLAHTIQEQKLLPQIILQKLQFYFNLKTITTTLPYHQQMIFIIKSNFHYYQITVIQDNLLNLNLTLLDFRHNTKMNQLSSLQTYWTTRFLQNGTNWYDDSPDAIIPDMVSPHSTLMPYLWSFVIDIAVFFALYKYTKYGLFFHIIIASFVALTTLITSFPILIQGGIPPQENDANDQRHVIIGIVVLAIILFETAIGLISRILQMIPFSSSYAIYGINLVHRYLGYALMILGKIQTYLFLRADQQNQQLFWGLFCSDMILLALLVIRKMVWPVMTQTIVPNYSGQNFQQIQSMDEIKPRYKYLGIFANYVYNIEPMRLFHPSGYQIIQSVNHRQLDRFLYGMYQSERHLLIPNHNHGFKTMNLLGDPVAKIYIPSVYSGLNYDSNDARVSKIQLISAKDNIYLLDIQSKGPNAFNYQGYSTLKQLGRYVSLTLNNIITRLYTTVGCYDYENIRNLRQLYFNKRQINIQPTNSASELHQISLEPITQRSLNQSQVVKILLKRYQDGNLTPKIIRSEITDLKISCSRGIGLCLDEIKGGKIILVAGGTGLYPFCDLIDLLFKHLLILNFPNCKDTLFDKDPILKSNPFQNFTFQMYFSVPSIEHVHPLTLAELRQLSKQPKFFKLFLRTPNPQDLRNIFDQNVEFVRDHFGGILSKKISEDSFTRMYICGPPRMNEEMLAVIDQHHLDSHRFMIL